MPATNLYQYYQSKGQALPSVADRAKIYESSGLGKASEYVGNKQQNVSLLAKLAGSTGGSSGGTGGGANTSSPSATEDYTSAYKAAQTLLPSDTSSLTALSDSAKSIAEASQAKAKALTEQIPVVQNLYTDLAAKLKQQFLSDTQTATKEKTLQVSKQAASAASSGIDTTTGFEAAMERSISEDAQKKIDTLATNYNIDSDKIVQESSKAVSDLLAESSDALISGNKDVAQIAGQMASIKQQEAALLNKAANDILSQSNKEDQLAVKQEYQSQLLDLKTQNMELAAEKLQLQKDTASTKITQEDIAAAREAAAKHAAEGTPLDQLQSAYAQWLKPNEILDIYTNAKIKK